MAESQADQNSLLVLADRLAVAADAVVERAARWTPGGDCVPPKGDDFAKFDAALVAYKRERFETFGKK